MTAAETLRLARKASHLSQVELANRAGVTQSVVSAYESGGREPSVPTLRRLIEATGHRLDLSITPSESSHRSLPDTPTGRRLRRQRRRICKISASRGARNIRVFGSAARGDDTAESDIDFLVDLDKGVGLIGLIGLERELSELLKADIDVVPADMLKTGLREQVEAEAIAI